MAKYRLKSEEEMTWNAVRRAATAELRLEAAAWLEKRLNDLLPSLQLEFQKTLKARRLPEIQENHRAWVKDAITAANKDNLDDDSD